MGCSLTSGNAGCCSWDSSTGHKYRLGEQWLEAALQEGPGDAGWQQLSRRQQGAGAAQRANPVLVHQTQHNHRSREVLVLLCSALVQPRLECWVQFWAPPFKEDVKVLEWIQRRAPKLETGLEGKSCEES